MCIGKKKNTKEVKNLAFIASKKVIAKLLLFK
ncbi:hypothetical protein CVS40_7681 [Lucilia cuprina]|nr:hypothetical protein CVS40_7681 [Lucilia cuprina]